MVKIIALLGRYGWHVTKSDKNASLRAEKGEALLAIDKAKKSYLWGFKGLGSDIAIRSSNQEDIIKILRVVLPHI